MEEWVSTLNIHGIVLINVYLFVFKVREGGIKHLIALILLVGGGINERMRS